MNIICWRWKKTYFWSNIRIHFGRNMQFNNIDKCPFSWDPICRGCSNCIIPLTIAFIDITSDGIEIVAEENIRRQSIGHLHSRTETIHGLTKHGYRVSNWCFAIKWKTVAEEKIHFVIMLVIEWPSMFMRTYTMGNGKKNFSSRYSRSE